MSLAGAMPLIWFFALLINGAFLLMTEVAQDLNTQTDGRVGSFYANFTAKGFALTNEKGQYINGTNSLLANVTTPINQTTIQHQGDGGYFDPIYDYIDYGQQLLVTAVRFFSFDYITATMFTVFGVTTVIPDSFKFLLIAVIAVIHALWIIKMITGRDN